MSDMQPQQPTATKLVRVRLSALTRVEYTEVVEVPHDITDDELNHLVNMRYQDVDGGCFGSDPEYWERGECSAVEADNSDDFASLCAFRTQHGLYVEAAKQTDPPDDYPKDRDTGDHVVSLSSRPRCA